MHEGHSPLLMGTNAWRVPHGTLQRIAKTSLHQSSHLPRFALLPRDLSLLSLYLPRALPVNHLPLCPRDLRPFLARIWNLPLIWTSYYVAWTLMSWYVNTCSSLSRS